jgi:hypothetical protein
MEKTSWNKINIFLKSTLNEVGSYLDEDSIKTVNHYIDHDEYEMAFEIIFLEIMKMHKKPVIDYKQTTETALHLKLDKQTIFDIDFWKKYKDWLK